MLRFRSRHEVIMRNYAFGSLLSRRQLGTMGPDGVSEQPRAGLTPHLIESETLLRARTTVVRSGLFIGV